MPVSSMPAYTNRTNSSGEIRWASFTPSSTPMVMSGKTKRAIVAARVPQRSSGPPASQRSPRRYSSCTTRPLSIGMSIFTV
jgi:hypothetical protein